jgi:predicted kinase
MTRLIITRGLPGCGKTTMARRWVAQDREHRVRVNRDDLRAMTDDGLYVKGVTEARVLAARDAVISSMLRKGLDVMCDDTNLPQRTARDLAALAGKAGAGFEVRDMTDVPLETCLKLNAGRTDKAPVPEEFIRDLHARYVAGRAYPLPRPDEAQAAAGNVAPYAPKPGTPRCAVVDIDGTTALKGERSPFDETRVHEDSPNLPVISVICALHAAGNLIVFLSGRTDACRDATAQWLATHVPVPFDGLHMRQSGDHRKDSVVKRELFDVHVRDRYDVTCVLDDRDQVVRMWREEIGLTCLQVAYGNF